MRNKSEQQGKNLEKNSFSMLTEIQEGNSLNFLSENVKLSYQIEKLLSENANLKEKIRKIQTHFKSELKNRDELILTLTNLMKEREENFKKIFKKEREESNKMLGKKEEDLITSKKKVKAIKSQLKELKNSNAVRKNDIEIENLRKLLALSEKENKGLQKNMVEYYEAENSGLSKRKIEFFKDLCFEFSVLFRKICKLNKLIKKINANDFSIHQVVDNSNEDCFEINKHNFLSYILKGFENLDEIEKIILDIYAMKYTEKCSVQ